MTTRREQLIDELNRFRDVGFPIPAEGHPYEFDLLDEAKDAVVRGRVPLDCSLIEEMSGIVLMHYWLATDRAFMRRRFFGRIKKYRSLFDALGRLPARQKVTIVRGEIRVPKSVASNVDRIFALRDLLAHVRTVDEKNPGYTYKGRNIFSLEGFELYRRDSSATVDWFVRRALLMIDAGWRSSRNARVRRTARSPRRATGTRKGQLGTIAAPDDREG
jgi:hypothetical protein